MLCFFVFCIAFTPFTFIHATPPLFSVELYQRAPWGDFLFAGLTFALINNNLKTLMGLPVVKGKDDYISDTVLYYFLKTAQSSSSTDEFLINIKCK